MGRWALGTLGERSIYSTRSLDRLLVQRAHPIASGTRKKTLDWRLGGGGFGQNAYSSEIDVKRSVFSMPTGTSELLLITTDNTSAMLPTMLAFSADVDSV